MSSVRTSEPIERQTAVSAGPSEAPAELVGRENPIEALAEAIQKLPAQVRWLHIQAEMIRAIASGTSIEHGPRTRAAEFLLRLAGPPVIARAVACSASLLLLLGVYVRQRSTKRRKELRGPIFVGIRALREDALLRDLEAEKGVPASYLDERGVSDFAGTLQMPWSHLIATWLHVARDVWQELGTRAETTGLPVREQQIVFLTSAHKYAFFLAWFSWLKAHIRIEEPVVFSASSYVAFAAVAAGVRAEYRLHGFQRQSLVYPDFEEVRCFTAPEVLHFKRRLPHSRVVLKKEPSVQLVTERVVVIAGCYGQTVGYDDCASFIAWAKKERIPVIIRPHPLDNSRFYEQWRTDPLVQFSDTKVPFDEFLERHRPRMVLSWYSTTLFDALRRGAVPVTVGTEDWRPLDMVFPFQEISLRWPRDASVARELMYRDEACVNFLASKRKIAGIEQLDKEHDHRSQY